MSTLTNSCIIYLFKGTVAFILSQSESFGEVIFIV